MENSPYAHNRAAVALNKSLTSGKLDQIDLFQDTEQSETRGAGCIEQEPLVQETPWRGGGVGVCLLVCYSALMYLCMISNYHTWVMATLRRTDRLR